jgi:hypothetical protein
MLNQILLKQKIYVVFFLLIFAVKPAMSQCPNIKDIKIAKSFGIEICAMPKVDDKYLIHAKKVMDKLIDYNNDGLVDNQKAIDEIIRTGSAFVIFRSEREAHKFENVFYPEEVMEEMEDIIKQNGWDFDRDEDRILALLEPKYGTFLAVFTKEMNLNSKGWDPTIEEALHLITHMGYAQAYPHIFGQNKHSEIAKLMDEARGGYFEKAQRRYPSTAYYTYDDDSCTYACQITEFTYWAITSLRGQQADRGNEISDEWQLYTPEKIRSVAPKLEKLLMKEEYKIFFEY